MITGKKTILTRFGKIEAGKDHCICRCPKGFKISPYLQDLMLFTGQQSVYSQAADTLNKMLHCLTDAKQIERLVHAYGHEVGQDFEDHIDQTLPCAKDGERNYVMMDGGMVLTRDQGWKEVKLGRIFAASDHLPEQKGRNWIRDSLYTGLLGSQRDFLKKLEPAVDRLKSPVFINDGAQWIWAWIDQYYPDAVGILDFYHAVEYLNTFAAEAFKCPQQAEEWITQQRERLLSDKVDEVIAHLQEFEPATKTARTACKKILTYYRNNRNRMQYQTYRKEGLMIGSGPIESAHKTVIQERMKKSGQRWTIEGANAMIQLRTIRMSKKWELVVNRIKNAA